MRVSFDDLLKVRIPAHLADRVMACAVAKDKTVSELVREPISHQPETSSRENGPDHGKWSGGL